MNKIVNIQDVKDLFRETEQKLSDLVGREIRITIGKNNDDTIMYHLILIAVCQSARVKPELVTSPCKESEVANARFITMYLINKYLGDEPADIATFFRRDRTSVHYAITTVNERIQSNDKTTVELLDAVEQKVFTLTETI